MFLIFPGMTWKRPWSPLLDPDHTSVTTAKRLLQTARGNISERRQIYITTGSVSSSFYYLQLVVYTRVRVGGGTTPLRAPSRRFSLCARFSLSLPPPFLSFYLSSLQYSLLTRWQSTRTRERIPQVCCCQLSHGSWRHTHTHTPEKYHVTRHLGVEKVPESFVEELLVSPFNWNWQIAQAKQRAVFLRNSAFLKPPHRTCEESKMWTLLSDLVGFFFFFHNLIGGVLVSIWTVRVCATILFALFPPRWVPGKLLYRVKSGVGTCFLQRLAVVSISNPGKHER